MDVTPFVSATAQVITGYGDMGFTVSGVRYEGSIIVLPSKTVVWEVRGIGDLTLESLRMLQEEEPRPALVLLGCGRKMEGVAQDVRDALRGAGMVVEAMDTGAACRTYNVLMAEGRDVVAALVAC